MCILDNEENYPDNEEILYLCILRGQGLIFISLAGEKEHIKHSACSLMESTFISVSIHIFIR
jgi:hypothetical protein